MEFAISTTRWVVGKALAFVMDGALEAWAASRNLGLNFEELKMELLYAQGMLDNAQGREIRSPALKELLQKLQQLAYNADDALDELDYFRIDDHLHGTYEAADRDPRGFVQNLVLHGCHTATAVVSQAAALLSSQPPQTASSPDGPGRPEQREERQRDSGCCPRQVVSSTRHAVRLVGAGDEELEHDSLAAGRETDHGA